MSSLTQVQLKEMQRGVTPQDARYWQAVASLLVNDWRKEDCRRRTTASSGLAESNAVLEHHEFVNALQGQSATDPSTLFSIQNRYNLNAEALAQVTFYVLGILDEETG